MNTPSAPPLPSMSQISQYAPSGDTINQQQQQSNKETAQQQSVLNSTNQQGPWGGGLQYKQDPTTGQWTATLSANPNAVGIVNSNLEKFQNSPGPVDPSGAVDKAVAMENQYMKPWFDQQQSNLDAKLQNQGFSVGSEAYKNAQRDIQKNQNDWVGGNVAQFEPIAYQQSQQSWLNPLQAATATAQGFSPNNNMVNTPQTGVTPTNIAAGYGPQQAAMDAITQQQNFQYQQQMQNNAAKWGGLFSIPSTVLGGWAKNGFAMPTTNLLFGGGSPSGYGR